MSASNAPHVTPEEHELPDIISVDDHVVEPPDLWSARLPASCRDRGPRVVRERGRMGGPVGMTWETTTDGAGAAPPERSRSAYLGQRPGTADSERLSLREMRLGSSSSRPSTASLGAGGGACSRPMTSSSGSRPVTAATSMGAAGGGSASAVGAPAPPRSPRSNR